MVFDMQMSGTLAGRCRMRLCGWVSQAPYISHQPERHELSLATLCLVRTEIR